ncbi:MAG: hypothetical protein ABI480_05480 [Chitinophagaceae bacterium]
MNSIRVALSALLIIGFACKNKPAAQTPAKDIYISKIIGWTVSLPEGWQIMTRSNLDTIQKLGTKTMSKVIVFDSTDTNTKPLTPSSQGYSAHLSKDEEAQDLLSITKDSTPASAFLSDITPANERVTNQFEQFLQTSYHILKATYAGKEIEYEEGTENIDRVKFYTFIMTLYSKDHARQLLQQKLYSRLINGYIFRMTVSSIKKEDFETLIKMVSGSTFSIRD